MPGRKTAKVGMVRIGLRLSLIRTGNDLVLPLIERKLYSRNKRNYLAQTMLSRLQVDRRQANEQDRQLVDFPRYRL